MNVGMIDLGEIRLNRDEMAQSIGEQLLGFLRELPEGIGVDSITVDLRTLSVFGSAKAIHLQPYVTISLTVV